MRMPKLVVLMFVPMLLGVLPTVVSAKRVTAAGSLIFTREGGPALVNELVVTTVMANPGLEKTVEQQLPLPGPIYVVPFFVNGEKSNPGQGDLDTLVTLTNTTGSPLSVRLTVRGADGNELSGSPSIMNLGPHETILFRLSDVLN
jgi:hypothetical protein